MEILVRLSCRHFFDCAFDTNLAPQRRPVKEEADARIVGDVAAFATVVVRVKNESAIVEALQEDDARGGLTLAVRRRQRHRNGILFVYPARIYFREPAFELPERINIDV